MARIPDCHPNKTYQARGLCKNCYDKWLKEKNVEYAKKQRSTSAKWHKENKDRKRAYDLVYRESTKDSRALRDKYRSWAKCGLSPNEANYLLEHYTCCPICLDDFGSRGPDLDHDHATGLARGFIYPRCNKMLGLIGDSIDSLNRAIEYLQNPPTTSIW